MFVYSCFIVKFLIQNFIVLPFHFYQVDMNILDHILIFPLIKLLLKNNVK